jgi:predicted AAA+ superfamily ATPase
MFHELVRRGYEVRIGRVKEKEVDFVCQKGDERKYFQVCYMMGSEETREREFSALLGINDQYPKVILSLDRINFSSGGIIHKKIPEFLLEKI